MLGRPGHEDPGGKQLAYLEVGRRITLLATLTASHAHGSLQAGSSSSSYPSPGHLPCPPRKASSSPLLPRRFSRGIHAVISTIPLETGTRNVYIVYDFPLLPSCDLEVGRYCSPIVLGVEVIDKIPQRELLVPRHNGLF